MSSTLKQTGPEALLSRQSERKRPSVQKHAAQTKSNELLLFRRQARRLGISSRGSVGELLQRTVAHLRGLASQKLPVARTCRPSAQERAEQFVVAWEVCSTAREVANVLGQPIGAVTRYASQLRRLGVQLRSTRPPGITYVSSIQPSAN